MTHYAIFETALGWAGVAWVEAGLSAVHLPEPDPAAARRGLLRRCPQAVEADPPAPVRQAIAAIAAQLAGEPADFTGVVLDLSGTPAFHARVYEIARAIPSGETLTYGEVATRLGDRLLARDVGEALGRNPWPIVVPCHRVTAAGGKLGGFSARGGARTKLRLLAIEGAAVARPLVAQETLQGDLFA
jgi:methylated-DNA-[protein]-cysteine S-methyltransferase